eukprot:CAMPEP_0180682432 /NCGR_PEP_ID=MMETSP1037_2-20121125/70559_1 /TAXON_ID=632150 /ORGANISM="Azadinium spinosum, Strain 3D9" /LENGTH=133 /DNA_ID=CAMNT_0022712435 /DNA_START=44 /DNA_END=442 /DNA_ORIENTATION=-
MVDLAEFYQAKFRSNPTWLELRQDPDGNSNFQCSIQLPSGQVVEGGWARGKQKAKYAAIHCALAKSLVSSKVLERASSFGRRDRPRPRPSYALLMAPALDRRHKKHGTRKDNKEKHTEQKKDINNMRRKGTRG